jgi:hypothetical protein
MIKIYEKRAIVNKQTANKSITFPVYLQAVLQPNPSLFSCSLKDARQAGIFFKKQ